MQAIFTFDLQHNFKVYYSFQIEKLSFLSPIDAKNASYSQQLHQR